MGLESEAAAQNAAMAERFHSFCPLPFICSPAPSAAGKHSLQQPLTIRGSGTQPASPGAEGANAPVGSGADSLSAVQSGAVQDTSKSR